MDLVPTNAKAVVRDFVCACKFVQFILPIQIYPSCQSQLEFPQSTRVVVTTQAPANEPHRREGECSSKITFTEEKSQICPGQGSQHCPKKLESLLGNKLMLCVTLRPIVSAKFTRIVFSLFQNEDQQRDMDIIPVFEDAKTLCFTYGRH